MEEVNMNTVDLEVLLANQEIREAKKMNENVIRKSEAEEVEDGDDDDGKKGKKKGKKKKDKKKKKGLMSRIFGFFTSQVKDSIKGGM